MTIDTGAEFAEARGDDVDLEDLHDEYWWNVALLQTKIHQYNEKSSQFECDSCQK
jgi:hypothetical protein